jgi:hypothetical protein
MVAIVTMRAVLSLGAGDVEPGGWSPIAIAAKFFVKALQILTLELFYGSQWQNLGQSVAK